MAEKRVVAQISISVFEDGTLNVNGPIHEKQWSLRVLHSAIETLEKYEPPVLPEIRLKQEIQ